MRQLLAGFLACVVVSTSTAAQTPAALDLESPGALQNWKRVQNGAAMNVNGTELTLTGKRGWWRSEHVFLDYVLHAEFRLDDVEAEGAVMVRAHEDRAGASPNSGFRIALVGTPNARQKLGAISSVSGALTEVPIAGNPDALTTNGDWHRLEVSCVRDRVIVRIDDQVVAAAVGELGAGAFPQSSGAGYVGLEHVRGTIALRTVTVSAVRPPPFPTGVATDGDIPGAMPVARRKVKSHYLDAVMRQKRNGTVRIQEIILPDGTIGSQRVIQSMDPDVDLEALAAARDWLYTPVTLNGQAVPFRIVFTSSFTYQ